MKKETIITTFIIILILILSTSIAFITYHSTFHNQRMEVIIGEKYLYSTVWESNNPFFEPIIDTVLVLDKKDGYVLYKDRFGSKRSSSLRYFKHVTRNIDENK